MRAIISVYDKTGVVEFARGLAERGYEIVSTGGTEALLRSEQIPVRGIEDVTGFPEILGGRVKTLHPAVHGGILALRDQAAHTQELESLGIEPVDVVAANLYPFLDTVRAAGASLGEALENIDIGGTTLLRAAAKNFQNVLVVCDPADYAMALAGLSGDGISNHDRRRLAAKAFQHCATYDTHVATYLRPHDEIFPANYTLALSRVANLRAGENPHQLAAVYQESTPVSSARGVVQARQLHGKDISFNNTYDADRAWEIVNDFSSPCVAIVKHGTPIGVSLGETVAEAYKKALAGDPPTAFGSAVAANRVVDEEAAREIASVFFEDLVAPEYTREALDVLRAKRDLRVFAVAGPGADTGGNGTHQGPRSLDYKRVYGGFLVQTWDALGEQSFSSTVVSRRQPSFSEVTSLYFAWRAVKHVRSNGVVVAKSLCLTGVGAGQASRLDAVDLACRKAGTRAQGSVLASDGFFPFPDAVERAADAGITAIIQPGGSLRDPEIIRTADRHGMAMVFTGERHYRH